MQKVTYFIATTIDGRIAAADGSFDMFVNEGEHVTDYLAALAQYDAVVMGRHTYEVATKLGVNDPYPRLRTFVFSKELAPPADTPNVTIVSDEEPASYVRRLKSGDGRGIYLCGGGVLAAHLLEHDVIDEIILKLNPVIAGSAGRPLFHGTDTSRSLELVESKVYASGVLVIRYRVVPRRAD